MTQTARWTHTHIPHDAKWHNTFAR